MALFYVMTKIMIFLVFVFANLWASSLPITIDETLQCNNITNKVFVYFDTNKNTTPDSALNYLRHLNNPYGYTYFDVNDQAFYWIYIPIVNKGAETLSLLLDVENPHIDTLYFWKYHKQQLEYVAPPTGDCWAFETRAIKYRNFVYSVSIPPDDTVEVLLKICKYGQPMALQFNLYTEKSFYENSAQQSAIHMLFFGALLLVIILLVVFALYLRIYSLLLLAIAMFCLMIEAAWQLGYGFQYLFRFAPWYNNLMRVTCLTMSVLFNVMYVYKTLDVSKHGFYWANTLRFLMIAITFSLLSLIMLGIFGYNTYSYSLKIFFLCINAFFSFSFSILIIMLFTMQFTKKRIALYMRYFYTMALVFMIINNIILSFPLHLLPYGFIKHISLIYCTVFILIGTAYVIKVAYDQQQETLLLREEAIYALINGQEQERQRIAQALHDSISNNLFVLRNRIQIAAFTQSSEKKYLIEYAMKIGNDIRNLSHRLAIPFAHKQALDKIIAELCDLMQPTIPQTKLTFVNNLPSNFTLSQLSHHGLLKLIVQELLVNIAKHACATNAQINLYIEDGLLHLLVIDNGVGFDTSKKYGGLGILNIEKYIDLMGGNLQIASTKQNTSFEISLPI